MMQRSKSLPNRSTGIFTSWEIGWLPILYLFDALRVPDAVWRKTVEQNAYPLNATFPLFSGLRLGCRISRIGI